MGVLSARRGGMVLRPGDAFQRREYLLYFSCMHKRVFRDHQGMMEMNTVRYLIIRRAVRLIIEQFCSIAHLGSFRREVFSHEDKQSYNNVVE
jgi:hypothetical protein